MFIVLIVVFVIIAIGSFNQIHIANFSATPANGHNATVQLLNIFGMLNAETKISALKPSADINGLALGKYSLPIASEEKINSFKV